VLRCAGELSVATVEALQRELASLTALGHPALTVNLIACSRVDLYGVVTLLEAAEQLRRAGRRLALVAGAGDTARLLSELEVTRVLPVYPTEEAANTALRGCGQPPPGPTTWTEARQHTVARWWTIRAMLEHRKPEPVLRLLTSMFGLCSRAEELFQELPTPAVTRCHCCPLFYELGGQWRDVGCRSMIDPIIRALRQGDLRDALDQVMEVIRTIERLSLPSAREVEPCDCAVVKLGGVSTKRL
jgi:anti-anti-sigma factor